jgi:HEAT repeat protein
MFEVRMSTSRLAVAFAVLSVFGPFAAADKQDFADLVANLKSPNAKTREQAASDLGKSRRREAVPPLSELVRDSEVKVRMAMVRALRELRDLQAVPALVTSLADGDPKIREEAVGTLVEIYADRERSGPVTGFLNLFSDEYDRASVPPYTSVDRSVYTGLAAGLRDELPAIRQNAALALGILDGVPALRDLQAALQDPEPSVRGAATTAIGKIGTAEDGKALIPVLADASGDVRDRALHAIGVLKVRDAGPALRELYEQHRKKDSGTRVLACLARIADPAQAELFRELVQDPDVETRRLAIEGLGRVADASMLDAFKKDYQRERREELRLALAFALTLLGDRAFLDSIVLSLPSRTLGRRCRGYILEMGTKVASDLYPYLNDPQADIRAALCDLLAQIGDPGAIERVRPLINDPNTQVADRANRAVERLKRAERSR